jgi:hypothetical protein
MLADELDYVLGVDTHRDQHALAVVAAPAGALLAGSEIAASSDGYEAALRFADRYATGRRVWAIEGTGSYGAGLARFLAGRGEIVAAAPGGAAQCRRRPPRGAHTTTRCHRHSTRAAPQRAAPAAEGQAAQPLQPPPRHQLGRSFSSRSRGSPDRESLQSWAAERRGECRCATAAANSWNWRRRSRRVSRDIARTLTTGAVPQSLPGRCLHGYMVTAKAAVLRRIHLPRRLLPRRLR